MMFYFTPGIVTGGGRSFSLTGRALNCQLGRYQFNTDKGRLLDII